MKYSYEFYSPNNRQSLKMLDYSVDINQVILKNFPRITRIEVCEKYFSFDTLTPTPLDEKYRVGKLVHELVIQNQFLNSVKSAHLLRRM